MQRDRHGSGGRQYQWRRYGVLFYGLVVCLTVCLFGRLQAKGETWQLEAKAPSETAWRVVASDRKDPLVQVNGLAPGSKYTFRSREGAIPTCLTDPLSV